MVSNVVKLCLNVIIAVNIHISLSCPYEPLVDAKAAYKSGRTNLTSMEATPITLDKIMLKLKEANIFDPFNTNLSYRDKKELNKLFSAVEIMTTSRSRQPANVHNMFSSLRMVERAVKKQLKEGQISESLASRFHWENLSYHSQKSIEEGAWGAQPVANQTSDNMNNFKLFIWDQCCFTRQKTEKPAFTLDKKTNMRVFNVKS